MRNPLYRIVLKIVINIDMNIVMSIKITHLIYKVKWVF